MRTLVWHYKIWNSHHHTLFLHIEDDLKFCMKMYFTVPLPPQCSQDWKCYIDLINGDWMPDLLHNLTGQWHPQYSQWTLINLFDSQWTDYFVQLVQIVNEDKDALVVPADLVEMSLQFFKAIWCLPPDLSFCDTLNFPFTNSSTGCSLSCKSQDWGGWRS